MKIVCVISEVDGQRYCVRNRKHLMFAADLLAKVTDHMTQLVAHLKQKWARRGYVIRLVENYDPRSIQETLPTSTYVAYTENKGDKMAFCTTTTKRGGKLIDLNTLTYVAVHELAHVACESIGHTDEFWRTFRTFLIEAVKIKIYKPVDYKAKPVPYCGTTISENILFDGNAGAAADDENEIIV